MKLSEIDSNFKAHCVGGCEFTLISPEDYLEGFPWENENEKPFCRLPERIASQISEPLKILSQHSAGGVIRFKTDSSALLLKGTFRPFDISHHMPLTGVAGFDVCIRENECDRLIMNMRPEISDLIQQKWDFELSCALEEGMNEYRIYLPLYAGLKELQIGFTSGAVVEKATPHKVKNPILYYGSSITQGGCASRTSTCYTAMVSSWLDVQQINLGFSGNAKGEKIVAEEIAALDLSCVVIDYDHNAPTIEHLRETHEPFFKIIREKNPILPIVLISRPFARIPILEECEIRRDIIMQTYLNAREKGDENVYFIDGMRFFEGTGYDLPTVDRCHPTDLGFYLMAKNIYPVIKLALN